MANQQGLGKGLAALFGEAPMRHTAGTPRHEPSPRMIPLAEITPNPSQPRMEFDAEKLAELAESIRAQGVLQPLLVRPVPPRGNARYEIVAGERRYRASAMAGLLEVPAVIREMSDEQAMLAALIENLQREDLNPMEEARGLSELTQRFQLTQEVVAERIGKSRSMVANTLRLLNLPEYIRRDIQEKNMTAGQARPLLVVTDENVLEELHRRIVDQGANARQVEAWVATWKKTGVLPALAKDPAQTGAGRRPAARPFEDMEKSIAAQLDLPIRIHGTPERGRLSIAFGSRREFSHIMNLLGIAENGLEGRAAAGAE